ncbi:MAG: hypothetical protein WCA46_06635, partial [Actinocatenispora sp.]
AGTVDPVAPDLRAGDPVVADPVLSGSAAPTGSATSTDATPVDTKPGNTAPVDTVPGNTTLGATAPGAPATAEVGSMTDRQPEPVEDDEILDPQTGEPDRYVPARDVPETREVREQRTGRHAAPEPPPSSGADFPLWTDEQQTRESRRTRADRRGRGRSRDTRRTALRPDAAARRARSEPRRPGAGLVLLVVLALAATFFGWVGAEPFWLSVGHGDGGTLTVTRCVGAGISKRCVGDFTAAGHRYAVRTVALSGAPDKGRPGATLTARMVSERGRQAYVGDDTGLLLRWALPLVLVLVLGLLIAAVTGARRLTGRHRLAVVGLSVLGPLVLAGGLLAVTW